MASTNMDYLHHPFYPTQEEAQKMRKIQAEIDADPEYNSAGCYIGDQKKEVL